MENLDIERIILKSLTEKLSEEENQGLAHWRAENPANEADYQAYIASWQHAGQYKTPSWDTEQALQKLQGRITPGNQQTKAGTPKRIPLLRRIASVAAVFLLIASIGYGVFTFIQKPAMLAVSAADHDLELNLADGTIVHLKQGATLKYPENFNRVSRTVEMTGEIYFDVARDPQKPFVVNTDRTKVTVLGTAFVIDASDEQNRVTNLYVTEGSVAFQSKRNDDVKLTVQAGQQARLDGNQLKPIKIPEFNDIAWHTNTLEFRNIRAEDAIQDISEYYHVEIDLSGSLVRDCPITAPLPFQDAPLEDVLAIMQVLLNVDIQQAAPGSYVFEGGKCK